jgi:UDP-glucose 4-epimerase
MSDKVLVTGAAGFVGSHLVERLATEQDDTIVATDIVGTPPDRYVEHIDDNITYRQGDITERSFINDLLAADYDRIYHLAAVVGVDEYVSNPLHITDVNIIATRNILNEIRDDSVRFIFTSTSEVYGKNPDVPWGEEDNRLLGPPTIDRWSYSTSKSACEQMIHGLLSADSGFNATIVRPFNLYGPGQRPKFVLPAFVERVVNDDVPEVYDDGSQTRCFTYIDDFIDALVQASTTPIGRNEVFNIGNTRETEIRELAELVLDIAGKSEQDPKHIDTDELYGESYEDLDRRVPEVSKAEQLLNWTAETPLEVGIERVLEWGRENYT